MANTPGQGHDAYIQVGRETASYGTPPATATSKLEILNADIQPFVNVVRDPSLYAGVTRRALLPGAQWATLKLSQRVNYEGFGPIWRGIFGTSTVAGPSESVVFTHTHKEQGTLDSFTFDVSQGDIPAGKVVQIVGCQNISAKLGVKAVEGGTEGFLTLDTEWIGQKLTDPSSTGTTPMGAGTVPGIWPVSFDDVQLDGTTLFGISGETLANLNLTGFELEYPQPHKPRPRLGNLSVDRPLRSDFVDPIWRWTLEYQGTRAISQALAFATGAVVQINFKDPTLIVGASTLTRRLQLKMGNTVLQAAKQPISGYGVIEQELEFAGAQLGSDASGVVVTAVNAESGTY